MMLLPNAISSPDDQRFHPQCLLCLVLKTAFETAQGSLLRTMAHSSMKSADGIHTKDTFVFVAILLLCAILSAISVLNLRDDAFYEVAIVMHCYHPQQYDVLCTMKMKWLFDNLFILSWWWIQILIYTVIMFCNFLAHYPARHNIARW